MAIPEFDVGDVVRLSVIFKDIDQNPVNPSDVALKVKTSYDGAVETFDSGQITSADAIEDPTPYETITAEFYMDYEITKHGDHKWRWEGTGTLIAASEGLFTVRVSDF